MVASVLALPLSPSVSTPEVVTPSPADRRTSARTPLFMLVNCGVNQPTLWATDIGLGGMQCRSKHLRFPGVYLDLSFRLPITGEAFQVGGQVTTLDQEADGNFVLGIRFCMVSPRLQMALYRFLDQRRALWGEVDDTELPWASDDDLIELPCDPRPLAALLWRHFHDLRQKEISSGSLDEQGPSDELFRVCTLLAG